MFGKVKKKIDSWERERKADRSLYKQTYNEALRKQKVSAIRNAAMNRAKKDAMSKASGMGSYGFGITGLETFKKGMMNVGKSVEADGFAWNPNNEQIFKGYDPFGNTKKKR